MRRPKIDASTKVSQKRSKLTHRCRIFNCIDPCKNIWKRSIIHEVAFSRFFLEPGCAKHYNETLMLLSRYGSEWTPKKTWQQFKALIRLHIDNKTMVKLSQNNCNRFRTNTRIGLNHLNGASSWDVRLPVSLKSCQFRNDCVLFFQIAHPTCHLCLRENPPYYITPILVS